MTGNHVWLRAYAHVKGAFAPKINFAKNLTLVPLKAALAAVLACTLVPAGALSFDGGEKAGGGAVQSAHADEADGSGEADALNQPSGEGDHAGNAESGVNPEDAGTTAARGPEGSAQSSNAGAATTLVSTLVGQPAAFINADVALAGDVAEPIVGSFTVDGLTYALKDGAAVLVAVTPSVADGADSATAVALPAAVNYDDVDYAVSAVGPYAFYLSGATSAELPSSVLDVDARAFRSSSVQTVAVADGNPQYSSYDGALYSADLSRLLLIPEGRQGAVRIPLRAETFDAEAVSHSALVEAFSVDAGSTHFSSEDGLLYNHDGTELLKVPAGAESAVVREGCETVAAGAFAGCAKLVAVEAPASVSFISPDAFSIVPTVSLPASALLGAGEDGATAGAGEDADRAPQLSALVALSSNDDSLPEVDPAAITVNLPEGADAALWKAAGFAVDAGGEMSDAVNGDDGLQVESAPAAPVASVISEDLALEAEGAPPVADLQAAEANVAGTIALTVRSSSTMYYGTSQYAFMGSGTTLSFSQVTTWTWYDPYGSGSPLLNVWDISSGSPTGYLIGFNATDGARASVKNVVSNRRPDCYFGRGNPSQDISYSNETLTLYPSAQAVTVSLDAGGAPDAGTGSVSSTHGGSLPNITVPHWPGYIFEGYWSEQDGVGTKYYDAAGIAVNQCNFQSNRTVYAKWTKRDDLYWRLLAKYQNDKFLDPANGVTPESLADGAYDVLMKYDPQYGGSPQLLNGSVGNGAWWTFTEGDPRSSSNDGQLTLTIWSEGGSAVNSLFIGATTNSANNYLYDDAKYWGLTRPYVERATTIRGAEPNREWLSAFGHGSSTLSDVVATGGMAFWFKDMLRLTDADGLHLTGAWMNGTGYSGSTGGTARSLNFTAIFQGCRSLTTVKSNMLDLSLTDPMGTKMYAYFNLAYYFEGCDSLVSVESGSPADVIVAVTSDGANFNYYESFFANCTSLTTIHDGFKLPQRRIGRWSHMFANCPSLVVLPGSMTSKSMTSTQDPSYTTTARDTMVTAFGFTSEPYASAFVKSASDASKLSTYYGASSLGALAPSTYSWSDSQVNGYWKSNYGRKLLTRQAANTLFFIPRVDATGDESVQSWVAVDADGKVSIAAESGIACDADGKVARPANPTSRRDGYSFAGWFKDPAYKEPFNFGTDTVEDYQCLWGKFVEGPFAITYLDGTDANAQIVDSTEVSVDPAFFLQPTYGANERVIIDAVPVREGYEFLGWTIEGLVDTPRKQAIIPAGTTGDKVAVAHWEKLPERNHLITTADAAAGYTVDNFPVATGVSSPKAWWTLDNDGELFIYCEPGAVISQANFPGWHYNTPEKQEAWGAVRNQVRSIVVDEGLQVEQSAAYTRQSIIENATLSSYVDAINEGMSWWFTWMPNLKDISGVHVPTGAACSGLFWGCWGLETLEGAYGVFQIPDGLGNLDGLFGCTGLRSLPKGFSLPADTTIIRCLFQGAPLVSLPDDFVVPTSVISMNGSFKNCAKLSSLPTSLVLTSVPHAAGFGFDATQDVTGYPSEYVAWFKSWAGGLVPTNPVRTFYGGSLSNLYPSISGKTADETKAYWLANYNRELVGPEDLVAPQSAVRFQVPKADGSGYVNYDVLTDASGRVTAPVVTKYGYSKVTWRYDAGTSGADLGKVAVSGPCGSDNLSFDADSLPTISAGLKGPVYAEISGLMLSMDMPVGSGNLWYAIDCGEVIALGASASQRAGMADAHELAFESYTPVPTELTATFTANKAPDGQAAAEKLFPNGLDEGTGFALALDGGASQAAGFKGLIDGGGSVTYEELVQLDASPSVQQPGEATGTLALKLGGTNAVDFAEETTEYSVADIVWTLDASAQYDFYATDDAGTYGVAEIKAAANAISAYGASNNVPAYRQYNRYLQQEEPGIDPVFTIRVYDQGDGAAPSQHKVDLLGIAQDTKTAGGKAGLSFGFRSLYEGRGMSSSSNGGWASTTVMRPYLRGEFAGKLGSEVVGNIVGVNKAQQLRASTTAQRTTGETVFLMSMYEVYGGSMTYLGRQHNPAETAANSFQYSYFAKGGVKTIPNSYAIKTYTDGTAGNWWLRGASYADTGFNNSARNGVPDSSTGTMPLSGVVPCFCF